MSDFARLQELALQAGLAVNPPSMVDVPYVSPETAGVGAVLNCTMGNWTNEPDSYTYQWMRDGIPVGAAEAERAARAGEVGTTADYTVLAGDAGHSLSCVVTVTNEAGSTIAPPSNPVTVTAVAARAAPEPAAARNAHADARRPADPAERHR